MKIGRQVDGIRDDLDAITFNPIASAILKLSMFRVVRGALLNVGLDNPNWIVYVALLGYHGYITYHL
jgi:hypothetical protein